MQETTHKLPRQCERPVQRGMACVLWCFVSNAVVKANHPNVFLTGKLLIEATD